jgi:PAS domain S-box-containing protein
MAVIPLTVISLTVLAYLAKATVDDVAEKNLLLARSASGEIAGFLREPLSILQNVKGILRSDGAGGKERVEQVLDSHVRHTELFESIYVLDASGKVASVGLPEKTASHRRDYLGLDLSHKDFYRAVLQGGGPAWSDTFLSLLSGKMAVAIGLALDERVLVGNFNLDIFSRFTERLSVGDRVTTTIVDRQGYIVVHPDKLIAARQVNIGSLPPVRNALGGGEGTHRYSFQGEELIGSAALITGPGWVALVSQRRADAYAPIIHAGILFALGVIAAVLLAVLTSMAMARRISRPLSEFSSRAKVVASGSYDFSLIEPRSCEVAELATSFKKMTEAVRERENELRQSEEKYRLVVENANDAIFVAQDGVIKFANRRAQEMTGRSPEYLASHPFSQLIHPEERDLVLDRYNARLSGEESPETATVRIIGPGEGTTWVLLSEIFIEWDGRAATLNFVRDISEQKSLEQQAVQAQKLESIGTLAGGIAHDFNNLLQAIQGYAELCLLSAGEEGTMRADLQEIMQAAQRGGELTRQLLLFSRKVESRRRPMDINGAVERTAKILERILPKMITVDLRLERGTEKVNADPSQIEQVLMNLAVNARDAMPEGGVFSIETGNLSLAEPKAEHPGVEPGEYVLLTVSDTGVGVGEENLKHIFEPFFTTKEAGQGTGLGLAMVYGIVRNHHGYIDCSSSPGEGTVFRIYLPVIETEDTVAFDGPVEVPKGGTETILLVDDEAAVLELGEKILTTFGYTVRTAVDGESALEIYRGEKDRIDMVVMDMIMPGMGGKKCLKEMLRINGDVKILISSGFSSGGTTREIIETGAKGLIRKPYTVNQLLRVIRATLDGSL